VVMIIASLALLTPLVRAAHKWHIDIRKTAKPADKTANENRHADEVRASLAVGVNKLPLIVGLILYVLCSAILLWMMFADPHPATARDVAMVGVFVATIVTTSRLAD